jgi:hypothetical protein
MFMNALILALVAGVFTIIGALIQRWQPNPKSLHIENSRVVNITSALEKSGLNIKLTQAGKSIQNVYLSRFVAKNTGKLGLKDVEFVVSVPAGAQIMKIDPSSDSIALVNSFSSKAVGQNSQVCTIGHINPGEEFNLIAYSTSSGANFECKQTDFNVFRVNSLIERDLKGFKGFFHFVKEYPTLAMIVFLSILSSAISIIVQFFAVEKAP